MAKLVSITISSTAPVQLAQFWVRALQGYSVDEEWPQILKSDDGPTLHFQESSEPRSGKNGVNINIAALDRQAEVEVLTELGATVSAEQNENGSRWTVMCDPEGNEFCVTEDKAVAPGVNQRGVTAEATAE